MSAIDRRGQELLEALARDATVLQVDEPERVSAGECRYCRCTDDNACEIIAEAGEPGAVRVGRNSTVWAKYCSWYRQPNHHGLGVCSNPECVKSYLADRGAP